MNEGLNTLSAADVAAVTRNNDGNMWGDGGWFWIIILAFLFCGNGWGNNNGAQDAFISDEFVKRDIFNTNQNVSNTACETQRDVLEKFGVGSQNFAKTHILWAGQTHNCITAIRWLRRTLRDVYGFTKLSYNEGWTDYLGKCVEVFQRNRGLTPDRKVGLITTYWLLSGIVK